jgi:hypothetical protein
VNFLTFDYSEGHFADNAQFPLSEAIEDSPLSLPMNDNYVITALNSIPLGVALDAESLIWQTGGNAPWLGENDAGAFDTVDAAGSGPLTDNQSSYLQTKVTGPGTLTFRWKVSSLSGDYLVFMINGVQKSFITGEIGWQQLSYNLTSGSQTLTWYYSKNNSGAAGSDRGWVDQVTFTPQ